MNRCAKTSYCNSSLNYSILIQIRCGDQHKTQTNEKMFYLLHAVFFLNIFRSDLQYVSHVWQQHKNIYDVKTEPDEHKAKGLLQKLELQSVSTRKNLELSLVHPNWQAWSKQQAENDSQFEQNDIQLGVRIRINHQKYQANYSRCVSF